jgi:hypothetical protein
MKQSRPFHEAKEYARKIGLPNQKAWKQYCKSGKKPKDIPNNPNTSYKGKGWAGWGDWLGAHKYVQRDSSFP